MATPKHVVLKYKTTDIGLNKVLEAYRDKINNIIKNVPWVTASVDYIRFKNTNETHYLEMFWGEDDLADRTLELNVNAASRVINLAGNLSITGNFTTTAANQVVNWTITNALTIADGGSINLQEDINFTGATTENLIKMPVDLLDALSIQEGSNKYVTFDTITDEEDILFYKSVDILHTSTHTDDHALEVDVNAATYGDVKAIDIDYVTGNIVAGTDEGILLINIDRTLATGGDIFALEVLATDQVSGSTGIYGVKIGPEIGPVHQDAGSFIPPALATDNHPSNHVAIMADGDLGTTTAIFTNINEYIIIGGVTAFQDIELVFSTASSKDIRPTFSYSISGTDTFAPFTPVDGTDGCRHTGVISWDASDVTGGGGHVADDVTGKFDIKIKRTKAGNMTTPVLGYAKTASTTEYVWDESGDVYIRNLIASGYIGLPSQSELRFYDNGNYVGFEAPALGADQIWVLPTADGANLEHIVTDGAGTLSWTTGAGTGNVIAAGNFGTDNVILRSDGVAKGCQHTGITIDNSNNMSGVGTISCGAITTSGLLSNTGGAKLEIQDTTDGTSAKGIFMWSSIDTGWGIYMGTSGANKSLANGVACTNFAGDTAHHIRFRVNDAAGSGFIWENASEACLMDLESDTGNLTILGNVGIGGSPTAFFDLDPGGVQTTAKRMRIIANSDIAGLYVQNNGTGIIAEFAGNIFLNSATSTITGGTKLVLSAGGTGICSQTIFQDTTGSGANMYIGNNPYQIKLSTSSRKFKNNIKDLEKEIVLSDIHKLRPVVFNSMCEFDDKDKKFIGLIAEEIELIYPEIVHYDDNNKAIGYDNQMITTLLLAEIQVLRKEIDELKIKDKEK